jgi:hypothetical protein
MIQFSLRFIFLSRDSLNSSKSKTYRRSFEITNKGVMQPLKRLISAFELVVARVSLIT